MDSIQHYAYIFQCEDRDQFRAGVTADMSRRLRESPGVRAFSERYDTKPEAREREVLMKAWSRDVMLEALDK